MRPLSHSSITLYRDCPQKWKLKYLDKIPEKPKHFFSFGKSVHSALEYFYNVPALPPPSLEAVLAEYKAKWLSEGYKNAAQEAEYFADGDRMVRAFYAKHIADFKPPFFAEYRFDVKISGVPVIGFVDRIDKLGPDSIAIVDYKTGKAIPGERVKTDAQLTMYQMACEELLGMKVESLTLYHVPSQTALTSPAHSRELVQELRSVVVSVASDIGKERFDPLPEDRKCSWCDFKAHCPVFKDAAPEQPLLDCYSQPRADADLASWIDRYGKLQDEVTALQAEAEELLERIALELKGKGWVRAFGSTHEVSLAADEKWEFSDKAKVLELIKRAGRWDDILAPSAPLVQKLMADPGVSADLRERLSRLGEKKARFSLKSRRVELNPMGSR